LVFQGYFPDQRIYHELSLPIGEGQKAAHELGELLTDLLDVVDGGLEGGDLILHRPQPFLGLALLLGEAVHLAVDEPDSLGGQAGP
jgi:hypothetical protein